jgi:hypothetical protein
MTGDDACVVRCGLFFISLPKTFDRLATGFTLRRWASRRYLPMAKLERDAPS